MEIKNELEAHAAIEEWRGLKPAVQLRNLRLALEGLELSQMYYQQKGSARGVERTAACLQIILARQAELSALSGNVLTSPA